MKSDSPFEVVSRFKPTGDQPTAIEALCRGLRDGLRYQVLEGVTGSGKTFTISNVIARAGIPVLVISHNKTLAAQLFTEFKGFFPGNAVEYFVSYYDYYQPEAYIPQTDTFIEKDASINEEIERLRLSATDALINRRDVIVVASVSCIYGLGSPEDYRNMLVGLRVGQFYERDALLQRLVDIQYTRNDIERSPGTFSVRGDTVDISPSYARSLIRVRLFGDEIERIDCLDPVSGEVEECPDSVCVSPARHFVLPRERIDAAVGAIRRELDERVAWFEDKNMLVEAQRLRMRTEYDIEMLQEMGYCQGIENYSRHLSGRAAGERPSCLIDFFDGRFLTIIDESHVTVPQLRGMYNGDRARKEMLVRHGFRLPSALDNRPMDFEEFLQATGPIMFTSATPGPFELDVSPPPVEQVIRPTGIADPPVEIRPLDGQVDDLIEEVRARAERNERVLVTTLTKRTAEDLSAYLRQAGLQVRYLHSEIDAVERVEVLRGLRRADFDCLVGINLLREGLDLPEVSLVAILDADKEGFLRSETSLLQTAGRAARHVDGKVVLYAERVTDSMQRLLDATSERRARQLDYNLRHGITPQSIRKEIQQGIGRKRAAHEVEAAVVEEAGEDFDVQEAIRQLEQEMMEAAQVLEYERAAMLRDQLGELRRGLGEGGENDKRTTRRRRARYPRRPASGRGRKR